LGLAACQHDTQPGRDAAVAWLLGQQGADGSFRSATYGVLRAGHSTTALAAYALGNVTPRTARIEAACRRALAFLQQSGVRPAEGADYPSYTAAFWLLTEASLAAEGRAPGEAPALSFLRAHQLLEARGWTQDDLAYAGFGFGLDRGPRPAEGDIANLSATTWAVLALRASGVEASDPALMAARVFVERCQVWDEGNAARHGGFLHQPMPGALQSKAGAVDGLPQPYASTTSDGWLALHALGLAESPRGAAAAAWLHHHARVPEVAGFAASDERHTPYEPALRLYAMASLALAWRSLPSTTRNWAAPIDAALRSRQRGDGAVIGWSPLLKEDDALVATSLAVLAWSGSSAGAGASR
jgi:hypothetical protein